jgi:hypothetical protein
MEVRTAAWQNTMDRLKYLHSSLSKVSYHPGF